MSGPTFSVKLGPGQGFSGGSKYSVTPSLSTTNACIHVYRYVDQKGLATVLATNRSAGVARDLSLRNLLHTGDEASKRGEVQNRGIRVSLAACDGESWVIASELCETLHLVIGRSWVIASELCEALHLVIGRSWVIASKLCEILHLVMGRSCEGFFSRVCRLLFKWSSVGQL